ncbi:Swt1 family HEPN domain-containing protein [Desulfovibrio sp. ZJ200]|uniref:Swt1 family HEPN domain-containing protein n=2 Tax=unclassified Desulfovibrio TaxID=2593640 RepID=UPI0013EDDB82|nr:Swt1 family HEPN domain-containing protein [Desulfovibrio sp. ZJ200]
MPQNHELVSRGFHSLLMAFAPYMCAMLKAEYGDSWWAEAVSGRLWEEQKRDLPVDGPENTLIASLDIQRCLILFDLHWKDVFRKRLSIDHRTWAKELMGVRNRLAHIGAQDFSNDDTWRALDTMSRLCEQIAPDAVEEIRALLRKSRYGSAAGSTTVTGQTTPAVTVEHSGILAVSPANLPSWREVMEPHPDVAQGRYRNAEFAADLAQVARGEGSFEYRDPVEFFARTYVTEGMKGLLVQAVKRVTGTGGEPVIQLKTAFGGGKTHSMLALYHLLRGGLALEKMPAIHPVLEEAGVSSLPGVHVAVLVGTALDPSRSKRPQHLPGVTVNTLWGEMAAQLAHSAGNPKLYEHIREADKKGISPGSEALKRLFDACGPCLILMDELVAYARRIYGVGGLPAGSFDNFITFIQEITEAARASTNSLVVASIPESDIEIGGEAGKTALETIEHTFGRMEAIWKPVAANEGFEVVRRRLFLNCKNPSARDMVCDHFSTLYRENPTDFPLEARELEYRNRLLACYPIHPEVFDRLYEDWATLERFQRTRGVLRLMAAVIHELWMGSDAGLLIMPGSLPLDLPSVRDELTRHLPEGWNSLVDREVDGKQSVPWQQDKNVLRYGKVLASRRVARTIMLGSAPTVRQQKVRGIETSRIRLGVVQPGEQIAVFNDALASLQNSLAYLYSSPSADRFWYDTRPTLRKTVEDRATQIAASDVEQEIERRLKKLRREPPFEGVHICPASSLDVPDEQAARLVILRPAETVTASGQGAAMNAVEEILERRGSSPRSYRNMLVFLAPDQTALSALEQETRRYLAWQSVRDDSQDLNLDAAQNRETENSLRRSNETVDLRLSETWCWLLTPSIDRSDMKTVEWEKTRLSGGDGGIIGRAGKMLLQNETVIAKWAPALLLMELDSLLWHGVNQLQIKQLWDYLTTYCYLPRLASYNVLEATILNGLSSEEYFAYAAAVGENRYIDLKYNQPAQIERSGFLVRASEARRQLEREQAGRPDESANGKTGTGADKPETSASGLQEGNAPFAAPGGTSTVTTPPSPPAPKSMRFFLSAPLDTTRVNRDVQRIVEEVISQLTMENGVTLNLKLEVEAFAPNGVQQQTVRAVSENCRTLKIDNFGFEEGEV